MTENNDLIRIFENDQFGNVRVVIRDDEPWFVAADVCRALDVGNPSQALTRARQVVSLAWHLSMNPVCMR